MTSQIKHLRRRRQPLGQRPPGRSVDLQPSQPAAAIPPGARRKRPRAAKPNRTSQRQLQRARPPHQGNRRRLGKKLALQRSGQTQRNQGQRRWPHRPIPLRPLWTKNCQDCHARRNKPHHLLHQLPDGGINKWRMSPTRILVHKLGCVTGARNNEEG